MVLMLVLDRWDVPDRGVQPGLVEPVHPEKGCQLEIIDASPWSFPSDALGLVEPDHALGQGVVERVTDGPDRGERAGVGEPFGVADRGVPA